MAQGGQLAPVTNPPSPIAQAIGNISAPAACCTDAWHWGILLVAAGCRETPADFGRSAGSDHGRETTFTIPGSRATRELTSCPKSPSLLERLGNGEISAMKAQLLTAVG